jgi:hypothetical protein
MIAELEKNKEEEDEEEQDSWCKSCLVKLPMLEEQAGLNPLVIKTLNQTPWEPRLATSPSRG